MKKNKDQAKMEFDEKEKYNLFVYGTLQFPEIIKNITGKSFLMKPAVLKNFKRQVVKGCDYPAVIPAENCITQGLLLLDVDSVSLKKIGFFEGPEYKVEKVLVEVDGEMEAALVFVWKMGVDLLDKNDWDKDYFEKHSLFSYLK